MIDKQIDYKTQCENYSPEVGCYCTFDGSCTKEQCFTYKLLQQLQRKKEQNNRLSDIIRKRNEKIKNLNYTLFEYRNLTPDLAKANLKISKLERKFSSMKGKFKYDLGKLKTCLVEIEKICDMHLCSYDTIGLILEKIGEVNNDR